MGKVPKYQEIIDWIEGRIGSGALHEGDRLETEAELVERFGYSRQTVRQALTKLEQDGVISRVQGSGSYVQRSNVPAKAGAADALLTGSVTIVSSYTDEYIFPKILQAMEKVLREAGFSSRIMFTNNERETERQILMGLLRSEGREPLIIEPVTSALPNLNKELYEKLLERGTPIIFFNTYYPDLQIPHVSLDDFGAGKTATDYLISLGHRKIGAIFKCDDGQGARRYAGYQAALTAAGIPVNDSVVSWVDTLDFREMMENCAWVLRRLKDCTACVCYNDEVAYMLTELCARNGISVPESLSLTSIDNSRLTELNSVPLTSVSHPMEKLGIKAAENLLELIRDPSFDATYEFAPELTERASAVELKAAGK